MNIDELRSNHRRFIYRYFKTSWVQDGLRFQFHFEIEPNFQFEPEVIIAGVDRDRVDRLGDAVLNNLAFHLGLMEIPSYWKATCSPEIVIEAGYLDDAQLTWWKDLLIKGMGEFFFVNQIDFTDPNFVQFVNDGEPARPMRPYQAGLAAERLLVPIGGGKDSIVTCEVLKEARRDVACWLLNPTQASAAVASASGIPVTLVAKRTIDGALLKLNSEGYLNGHTPFSACLAFLSGASAILFDYQGVAVSNENSSNEGNVRFLEHDINHQYSKSFAFEESFRDYSKRYLAPDLDYFSLVRPLYELQISQIFVDYPQYFPIFLSCNRGQAANSWCGACPKCLFAAAIIYPFLGSRAWREIFGENLFDREELIDVAFALLGMRETKPFECVGTREETAAAFFLCQRKAEAEGQGLPVVLRAVAQALGPEVEREVRANDLMQSWSPDHAIPVDIEAHLKNKTYDDS